LKEHVDDGGCLRLFGLAIAGIALILIGLLTALT